MLNSTSLPVAAAETHIETRAARSLFSVYCELGKARLSGLVLITTAVGFVLASDRTIDWTRLALTLIGTGLAAAGANAWNQWLERDRDARMNRTRWRPLPSGRVSSAHAAGFALVAGLSGPAILAAAVNPLAAALALGCEMLYVLVYTPLKVRSPLNTLVGAIVGAIPPMIGWAAVAGRLDAAAWILGGILFVWQIPHFLALAWLYREDYARGGFRMLPIIDPPGKLTCRVITLYSITLLPMGLMVTVAGLSGMTYAIGSLVLAALMVYLAVRLERRRADLDARRVFLASIAYLPLVLGLMVIDRTPAGPPLASDGARVAFALGSSVGPIESTQP